MNTDPPHLILVSGPPGVGKSSLSYRLAHDTGWAVFAKDQFDRTLERLEVIEHPPITAYELMLDLAELNLCNGVSVILDAVFPRQGFRQRAMGLAVQYGTRFHAVVCWCSDSDLWRYRIEGRPQMVRGWTPAGWAEVQRVAAYYESWTTPHLVLDAKQPFEQNFAALLNFSCAPAVGTS